MTIHKILTSVLSRTPALEAGVVTVADCLVLYTNIYLYLYVLILICTYIHSYSTPTRTVNHTEWMSYCCDVSWYEMFFRGLWLGAYNVCPVKHFETGTVIKV